MIKQDIEKLDDKKSSQIKEETEESIFQFALKGADKLDDETKDMLKKLINENI